MSLLSPDAPAPHLSTVLALIKDLLELRGSLASREVLAAATDRLLILLSDVPISLFDQIIQTLSLCHLVWFETTQPPARFEPIFDLWRAESQLSRHRLLLTIMVSIIEQFNIRVPHLTELSQRSLRAAFRAVGLFDYFRVACDFLTDCTEDLLEPVLTLFRTCLSYDRQPDIYQVIVPDALLDLFLSIRIPRVLFQLYEKGVEDALDLLLCFSSCATQQFTSLGLCTSDFRQKRLSYLGYVFEALGGLAGSAGLAESHVIAISRAVFKFSMLMPVAELNSAMPFVEVVAKLSAVLFERISEANWEACVTLLGFWERLAKGKSLRHANVLGDIVHGFIKGLCIPASLEQLCCLWSIAPKNVREREEQTIAELIGGTTENVERLNLLVQLAAASVRESETPNTQLVSSVLRRVSVTKRDADVLEASFVQFFNVFQRKLIVMSESKIWAALPDLKSPQAVFDLFVDRFLADLQFPDLIPTISEFLLGLVGATTNEYLANNSTFQKLVKRESVLDFSEVEDWELRRKFISVMNQSYAKSIRRIDDWPLVLAYFDQQFTGIAENVYRQARTIAVLYCELYGIFRGSDDFVTLFRWFLSEHAEGTLNCFKRQCVSAPVITSIGRLWRFLCANYDKVPRPDRLELFRHSTQLLRTAVAMVPASEFRSVLLMRVIRDSLQANQDNFGVMQHFADPSLDQMLDIFFDMVRSWDFAYVCTFKNGVQMFLKIFMTVPVTKLQVPESLAFVWRTLMWDPASPCFRIACHCLEVMMEAVLFDEEFNWVVFRSHFVVLMGVLLGATAAETDCMAGPLLYVRIRDEGFVAETFQLICGAYDEEDQRVVDKLLTKLYELTDDVKAVRLHLVRFRKEIIKRSLQIAEIHELQQWFR
jgi:hypothetical protein